MIRKLTVALALAGPLAGLMTACGAPDRVTGGPAPRQQPYSAGPIGAGHWGIGPIREDSYFEQPVIQALFPRAKVESVTLRISHDETRDGIAVTQDGAEQLEISDGFGVYPGTDDPMLGQARGIGPAVRGPGGETVGMSWKAAHIDLSQCEIGADRDRNTIICARRGEGAVTYQFAIPGWDSEEVPPESAMRRGAYLKAIIWSPPPQPGMVTEAPPENQ
jgi:hypothetical protein